MKRSHPNTLPFLMTLVLAGSLLLISFQSVKVHPFPPPPLPPSAPPYTGTPDAKAEPPVIDSGPIASFGPMSVYTATRGKYVDLALRQGDVNTFITEGTNDTVGTHVDVFENVIFSPRGNYLTYDERSYEGFSTKVYDINSGRVVLATEGGNFNPLDTLYYTCYIDTFGGGAEARVYRLPGFTVKQDFLKGISSFSPYQHLSCVADVANNVIRFIFSGIADPAHSSTPVIVKTYVVDLTTGDLKSAQ